MQDLTGKQKKIFVYIGHFTQKKGYPPTVREIGKQFKIASSSVFDHLKALEVKGTLKRTPGKSRSLKLFETEEAVQVDTTLLKQHDPDLVEIPLLGKVAAGLPLLAVENIEEMIMLPRQWVQSGKIFALRIHGDSMIDDGIHHQDLILVRTQSDANNGEIVVALLEDEATVKRLYKRGHSICLRAANVNYPDIITRNIKILGKVVGLFRTYS